MVVQANRKAKAGKRRKPFRTSLCRPIVRAGDGG